MPYALFCLLSWPQTICLTKALLPALCHPVTMLTTLLPCFSHANFIHGHSQKSKHGVTWEKLALLSANDKNLITPPVTRLQIGYTFTCLKAVTSNSNPSFWHILHHHTSPVSNNIPNIVILPYYTCNNISMLNTLVIPFVLSFLNTCPLSIPITC